MKRILLMTLLVAHQLAAHNIPTELTVKLRDYSQNTPLLQKDGSPVTQTYPVQVEFVPANTSMADHVKHVLKPHGIDVIDRTVDSYNRMPTQLTIEHDVQDADHYQWASSSYGPNDYCFLWMIPVDWKHPEKGKVGIGITATGYYGPGIASKIIVLVPEQFKSHNLPTVTDFLNHLQNGDAKNYEASKTPKSQPQKSQAKKTQPTSKLKQYAILGGLAFGLGFITITTAHWAYNVGMMH